LPTTYINYQEPLEPLPDELPPPKLEDELDDELELDEVS
jgi:hypothetical protein